MHSVGYLLGSNLSEFPHHQLLLQWCYNATELSRSLRNVSKAVIVHQDIKTLVRATTDAHYEENGLALFSMSFSRHWCNTEYIMPYIILAWRNDVLTTLWCFENLEKWSLYFMSKTWRVEQDHSGETNVSEENYICSSQFRPGWERIS